MLANKEGRGAVGIAMMLVSGPEGRTGVVSQCTTQSLNGATLVTEQCPRMMSQEAQSRGQAGISIFFKLAPGSQCASK